MKVGELSRRTGVGVSTLRVWERRYGLPRPDRAPSGQRRYGEHHVDQVNAVVRLVAEGMTLPAAIQRVATAGASALADAETGGFLYRRILDVAGQGIWVICDLRTRYVNQAMADLMRSSRDELVRMPVLDIFMPEDLPLVKQRTSDVHDGQTLQFTQRLRRGDRTTFLAEVRTTPMFDERGRSEGSIALVVPALVADRAAL
jgi:PAS domain S-box-containing protein